MTKPTRVLLYFILLVLLSLPLGAFADAQVSSEYEYYVDTDNKAILTKYLGSETIVKVPSKIDGYPVKATERTFADNHALEKVVIPNGITSIGIETFLNCNNLKRVRISKTVEELGERAFLGTGLTRLTLPETTWHIGKACFYACTELKFVKATADQLVIEPYAFFKSGIEGLQTSREPSYAANSFSHVCEFYYNSTTAFVMRHEPVRLIAGFLSRCPLPLRALYVLIFAILAALFLCLLTLFFVRIGRVIGKDKLKIYNEYNAQCAGIVSLTDDSAIIRNKVVPTRTHKTILILCAVLLIVLLLLALTEVVLWLDNLLRLSSFFSKNLALHIFVLMAMFAGFCLLLFSLAKGIVRLSRVISEKHPGHGFYSSARIRKVR